MDSRIKQDFFKLYNSLLQVNNDGRFLVYLGILILFGIGLRLAFLWQPIRYDEAFSYNVFAQYGVREILTNYGRPNNHIFHTLLVYFAAQLLGNEPWIIRLPSLIAGVLVLPVTYIAGRIHYNKEVGLLATALVASSSVLIEYSTNARGYEIICLFSLLMMWMGKVIKSEDNLVAWLIFTIAAALGLFTIPVMLYPYGGFIVWLLASSLVDDVYPPGRKIFLKHLLFSSLAVGILVGLLYLPVVVVSGLERLIGNQFVQPENLSQGIKAFGLLLSAMWGQWNTDIPLPGSIFLLLGFIASMVFHRKLTNDKISLALVQIAWCILIMGLMHKVPPWSRVFLYLLPMYLIWSSAGIVFIILVISKRQLQNRQTVYGGIVLVAVLLLSLNLLRTRSVYYSEQTGTLRDGFAVVRWLGEHLQEDDAVISFVPSDAILEYYFNHENIKVPHYSELGSERDFKRAFIITNTSNQQSVEYILSKLGFLDDVDLSTARLVNSFPSADIIEIR